MPWKKISDALGVAEGGAIRTLAGNMVSALGLDKLLAAGPAEKKVAFTIALIALCAKLSKADGVTLRIEAEAFEQVYHVPESERANVRRLFDLAKQDVAGFESYARKIARLLADEPELKRNVVQALFHVALADGVLHEAEEACLWYVAERFGFSRQEYRAIRALCINDPGDPYVVLGLTPDSSDEDVKRAYRRLVRQYHPDTMIAAGVPQEFAEIANSQIRAINAAYETISDERDL